MQCHKCNAELADNAILCDTCGAVVSSAPTPPSEDAVEKRCRRIQRRRFFAFAVAALVLVSGIVGMLVYSSPEAVATRYLTATVESDVAGMLELMAGDMRDLLENELSEEERNAFFTETTEAADALGLKNTAVSNFRQCYALLRRIEKANLTAIYGEGYKITVKIQETADMSMKDFERIRDAYLSDTYASYVDVNRMAVGKYVIAEVTVSGVKATKTLYFTVPLIKYNGAWKVAYNPYTLVQ